MNNISTLNTIEIGNDADMHFVVCTQNIDTPIKSKDTSMRSSFSN